MGAHLEPREMHNCKLSENLKEKAINAIMGLSDAECKEVLDALESQRGMIKNG